MQGIVGCLFFNLTFKKRKITLKHLKLITSSENLCKICVYFIIHNVLAETNDLVGNRACLNDVKKGWLISFWPNFSFKMFKFIVFVVLFLF